HAFLRFARSPEAQWPGNFRDFNAAIVRMSTFAPGGRIVVVGVQDEIERLKAAWKRPEPGGADGTLLEQFLGSERAEQLDRFDRVQLADVLKVCTQSATLSGAGRTLFAISRAERSTINDADRLRKYLARYGLDWQDLREAGE